LGNNTGENTLVADGEIPQDYGDHGGVLLGDNSDGEPLGNATIQPYLDHLLDLQKNVLAQISEVGGRLARAELMEDRFSRDFINYTQMKSDVEDLDYAGAMTWFTMAESVYRAALGVGGRILPPSLMDFMR
jgi:flagellar hook-associated protein 3 FlgL